MRARSRSTTSRVATLWTRPADSPGMTFFQSTSETSQPTRRSRMRRASWASTSLRLRSRELATASSMAARVISWKTMRRTGHPGREHLQEVPGDGLTLAILVGGEIDLAGVLEQGLQLRDLLFFSAGTT